MTMEPLRPGDRVALLTSGGDAPGMNAALRAAAKVGAALGLEMLGVDDGYRGLMEGRVRGMNLRALDDAARRGGTILGSARSKHFMTAEGRKQAQESIVGTRLSGLMILGGNGSLAGAQSLDGTLTHDGRPLRIVGLPASIDNDIGCTATAIGVDTAMNTIVEACDRIADTAGSHQRTFIVEVMGRDCGYLAMVAGLAAQADAVLFPEAGKSEGAIVDHVMHAIESAYARQGGRRHVLIIKSEGVKIDSLRLPATAQLLLPIAERSSRGGGRASTGLGCHVACIARLGRGAVNQGGADSGIAIGGSGISAASSGASQRLAPGNRKASCSAVVRSRIQPRASSRPAWLSARRVRSSAPP